MSDEDNIIREIEDDLRRERYERLWKKFGPYVIGAVVVVLVTMIGWQQYQAWQDRQRMREAEAFLAAAELMEQGKAAEAANAFEQVAAEAGSGYRTLGRLYAAEAYLKDGDTEKALGAFEAVAADGSADPKLRGLAALKSGLLLAETASPEALRKRLAPALRPNSPWRYAAEEIVAYADYRAGETDKARNAYQRLVNEFDAPAHIRERARSMLALIASEEARGAGKKPASKTGKAPEGAQDQPAPAISGGGGPQADTEKSPKDGEKPEAPSGDNAPAKDGAEREEPH